MISYSPISNKDESNRLSTRCNDEHKEKKQILTTASNKKSLEKSRQRKRILSTLELITENRKMSRKMADRNCNLHFDCNF